MCGDGDAGQLGTGKRDQELKPVQLSLISETVSEVSCGIFHTLILTGNPNLSGNNRKDKGRVYSTGGNTFGQLGLGNKKNTNIPTRIKELENQKIVKIACGHHSAALNDKGEIYVWGTGMFGEYLVPARFSQTGNLYKDIAVGG